MRAALRVSTPRVDAVAPAGVTPRRAPSATSVGRIEPAEGECRDQPKRRRRIGDVPYAVDLCGALEADHELAEMTGQRDLGQRAVAVSHGDETQRARAISALRASPMPVAIAMSMYALATDASVSGSRPTVVRPAALRTLRDRLITPSRPPQRIGEAHPRETLADRRRGPHLRLVAARGTDHADRRAPRVPARPLQPRRGVDGVDRRTARGVVGCHARVAGS